MKIKINYSAELEIPEIEEYAEVIERLGGEEFEDIKKEFKEELDFLFYRNEHGVKFESNFDMIVDK
ncbi:MAG: hypothetical protein ACTTKY_00160 [Catonella sp.]